MRLLSAIFAILLTVALVPVADAHHTSKYLIEILVDGQPLRPHHARGNTYVEARENAEYAVRLSNRTGKRIAIALSIDGLNSIDAKTTTAYQGSKWVLDPWQSITVDGWQTSNNTARRFFFTTEDKSYGEWLGKTTNLGVISAAVFAERRVRTEGTSRKRSQSHGAAPGAGEAAPDEKCESAIPKPRRSVPIPDPTPDEPEPYLEESDALAATGIGREVDHSVRHVRFVAENNPAVRISIRYEYRPQLVRLGVLPAPYNDLDRREQALGFTDFDFAPDPYRKR